MWYCHLHQNKIRSAKQPTISLCTHVLLCNHGRATRCLTLFQQRYQIWPADHETRICLWPIWLSLDYTENVMLNPCHIIRYLDFWEQMTEKLSRFLRVGTRCCHYSVKLGSLHDFPLQPIIIHFIHIPKPQHHKIYHLWVIRHCWWYTS